MTYGAGTIWKKQMTASGLRQQTKLSTLETVAQMTSSKEDVGISLIKERKEAYPIRNQRNREGRVCMTALFIQTNQCVK